MLRVGPPAYEGGGQRPLLLLLLLLHSEGAQDREDTLMSSNIILKQEGTKLHIEVDLAENLGPSKSGKTLMIASTNGNIPAPNDPNVRIGINIYRYRTAQSGQQ